MKGQFDFQPKEKALNDTVANNLGRMLRQEAIKMKNENAKPHAGVTMEFESGKHKVRIENIGTPNEKVILTPKA